MYVIVDDVDDADIVEQDYVLVVDYTICYC